MAFSVDLGTRYLELALRLRRLAPWLVESYIGPTRLTAKVDEEPPPTIGGLREQVGQLYAAVGEQDVDPRRRSWLSAQLTALRTTLDWLAGERFTYRQLVERCHGVRPTLVPEEQFALAHQKLADVLPGRGELRERYQRWAATQLVPPELLLPGLQTLAAELRRRTDELFGLPRGEAVIFELVQDKPYGGNAESTGGLRTRVAINQDLPIRSFRLLELVAHEAYPGHHTEQVNKEAELIQGRGHLELSIYLYPTPQALLAEGIATLALEALLGERADAIAGECLRPLGVPYDAETAAAYGDAAWMLLPLRANLRLLLDNGRSTDQVRTYARRWMLEADDYVDRMLESTLNRRWAPYESCYPEGLKLCRRFTAGEPARFVRLLHEQLTTSDLIADPRNPAQKRPIERG